MVILINKCDDRVVGKEHSIKTLAHTSSSSVIVLCTKHKFQGHTTEPSPK